MPERARKPAGDFESKALPQSDRPFVGRDDKIELHRPKSSSLRMFERMRAHRPRNSPPRRMRNRHVTAVRHVIAAALLIRLHEVSTGDLAVLLGHENLVPGAEPVCERLLPAHI